MPRGLYFAKRSGGPDRVWWRCGCCGQDQDFRERQGASLMLGNRLFGNVCEACRKDVSEKLSELYGVRAFPDLDDAGNLLGDF